MLDDKTLITIATLIGSALIGWLFKTIFSRIDKNETAVRDLERSIKQEYQSKELARETNKSVMDKLDAIAKQLNDVAVKLDKKVDK